MIVTRPDHDLTTRYLSYWAEGIIHEAQSRQYEVVDLRCEQANRNAFEGRARKLRPEFVFLNGHGAAAYVCGYDNAQLVAVGTNEDTLHGAITYAVSCDSARVLGEVVGRHERSSYIGYDGEFVFPYDPHSSTRPMSDQRARPFMDFSNTVARTLLKGASCANVLQRAKRMASRHVRMLLSSTASAEVLQHAKYMLWDADMLTCHGEQDRSL